MKGLFDIHRDEAKRKPRPKGYAPRYFKGSDVHEKDATYKTFGISEGAHANKIVVYGDEGLRNRILNFLNS